MSKEKSHDQLVRTLELQLRSSGRYYIVLTEVPYGTATKTIGEIDVLAIGYDLFDIYEVKGSNERNSLRKAADQVRAARRYLGQEGKEFIYTPQNGIESLDIVVQRLHSRHDNKKKE